MWGLAGGSGLLEADLMLSQLGLLPAVCFLSVCLYYDQTPHTPAVVPPQRDGLCSLVL